MSGTSPDGRYFIYGTSPAPHSLRVLPLFGERKPFVFVPAGFNATYAQFSPNGRYVAYQTDATGKGAIFVETFPEHRGKWQISTNGARTGPLWRPDGKELFYAGPDMKMMAVEIDTDSAHFKAGRPKPLFPYPAVPVNRNTCVVTPDGQRFLMIVAVKEGALSPINVIDNWPALLKKQ